MTVSNIVKRFLQKGSVENKARSGRPKVVTDRDYGKLKRLVKVNPRDSLGDFTSKSMKPGTEECPNELCNII